MYEELVKQLRTAKTVSVAWKGLMADAAAAIEELQAERDEWIDRCYHADEKVAELSQKVAELQVELDKYHELCDVDEIPEVLEILMTV